MIRQIRQRRQQARQVTDTENRRGNEARRVGGTHKGGRLEEKRPLCYQIRKNPGADLKEKEEDSKGKEEDWKKKNKRLEKKNERQD